MQYHAALLQSIPEDKRDIVAYFNKKKFDKHEDIFLTTLDYMIECLEEIKPPGEPL